MTLQEAKDQVARKCGFEDFRHAEFSGVFEDRFWEESAELYARSKLEAILNEVQEMRESGETDLRQILHSIRSQINLT